MDDSVSPILNYLGFREEPFSETADPRYFYPTNYLSAITSNIVSNIKSRIGLMVVIGDKGIGKSIFEFRLTMLFWSCENYLGLSLHNENFKDKKRLTETLLKHYDLTWKGNRYEKIRVLENFYEEKYKNGEHLIWTINNAQNLTEAEGQLIVEQVLGNEVGEKRIQIICFSTPEIIKTNNPIIRNKLTKFYSLPPLSLYDVGELVRYRCIVAGREQLFTDQAILRIFDASGGIPRRVVKICNDSLKLIFEQKKDIVDDKEINLVAIAHQEE